MEWKGKEKGVRSRKELFPDRKLVERFLALPFRYAKTVSERSREHQFENSFSRAVEEMAKKEELFRRYLRLVTRYKGEVSFVSENLILLQGRPIVPLPHGYALKGGAARASLERALCGFSELEPRDIDIVYVGDPRREDRALSNQLAAEYSPEDFDNGHGVEILNGNYFETRDFTVNEVLVGNGYILVTLQGLLDTIRRIIRFSEYEKGNFYFAEQYGEEPEYHLRFVNDKLAAKALRMIAERGDFTFIDEDFFQYKRINDFHMALHLDYSAQRGRGVVERFVRELKKRRQIPDHLESLSEIADYLSRENDFVFRHLVPDEHPFSLLSEFEKEYLANFPERVEIEFRYEDIIRQLEEGKRKRFRV